MTQRAVLLFLQLEDILTLSSGRCSSRSSRDKTDIFETEKQVFFFLVFDCQKTAIVTRYIPQITFSTVASRISGELRSLMNITEQALRRGSRERTPPSQKPAQQSNQTGERGCQQWLTLQEKSQQFSFPSLTKTSTPLLLSRRAINLPHVQHPSCRKHDASASPEETQLVASAADATRPDTASPALRITSML